MVQISKEEIEKLKGCEGETLGFSLVEDMEFILKKEGKEGLRKVEEEMEKLGYPLKYKEIKKYQFYPLFLNILVLLLAKNIFGWQDEVFEEMGRQNAEVSMMTKIMMRYFVSLERTLEEAGRYWRKYFTAGKLDSEGFNQKERRLVLVLKDFQGHPLLCRTFKGYFWQIISYVLPRKNLKVEEIVCEPSNKIHKFKITW